MVAHGCPGTLAAKAVEPLLTRYHKDLQRQVDQLQGLTLDIEQMQPLAFDGLQHPVQPRLQTTGQAQRNIGALESRASRRQFVPEGHEGDIGHAGDGRLPGRVIQTEVNRGVGKRQYRLRQWLVHAHGPRHMGLEHSPQIKLADDLDKGLRRQ